MKAVPDCIPCMFTQALNTVRHVTDDEAIHEQLLKRLAAAVPAADLNDTPSGVSQVVYDLVAEVTGVADPYKKKKAETNAAALALIPQLEKRVEESNDPLDTALRLAAAGNVIDLGIAACSFDIEKDIEALMKKSFAINAIEELRADVQPGTHILYLGDNSGEIVFDRILVEQLLARGAHLTFVVKGGPVINDALIEDAQVAGICDLVPVMDTGSNAIGVNWRTCSKVFRSAYDAADLILSKGQANYETVPERAGNIYCLLKVKCPCVGEDIGNVELGDLVFLHKA